ncbi:hypothetical protein ACTXT7_010813 [Hymenolepis weldensis]
MTPRWKLADSEISPMTLTQTPGRHYQPQSERLELHVPKFKFHDSSSGFQQMLIYGAQLLLIGIFNMKAGLVASIHFPLANVKKAEQLYMIFTSLVT